MDPSTKEVSISGKVTSHPQIGGRHVVALTIVAGLTAATTRHHIFLVDCSGSMSSSIDESRKALKGWIECLDSKKDKISLIIFSGHNESKVILAGASCDDNGRKMAFRVIDAHVRIMGTTVFSEPLKESIDAVKTFAGPGLAHNVVMFTDGCAVPTLWSVSAEETKSVEAATVLRHLGASVSTIGFGPHYDASFLDRLVSTGGATGIARHISEINDLGSVVREVGEAFARTIPGGVELKVVPNRGDMSTALRTTPGVTPIGEKGSIKTHGLYDGTLNIVAEVSGPCTELALTGHVGDQTITITVPLAEMTKDEQSDALRTLAVHAFLKRDVATATTLLNATGDAGLASKANGSYTERERRETSDTLRRIHLDKRSLGNGTAPQGNDSVLDVILTLIEDEKNTVYLPKGAYKRSGRLTTDPRVIDNPMGRSLKVVSYASHETRMNFSMKALKDIKLLPESGDGPPTDSHIWRTYNIILDSNLHVTELEASLSQESFTKLQTMGVLRADAKYAPNKVFTIDLRKVKTVSPSWADPKVMNFVGLLREEQDLAVKQTELNTHIKAMKSTTTGGQMSSEEGDVYHPKSIIVKDVPTETYAANCVDVRIMKYKPKLFDASGLSFLDATSMVKEVRQRLLVNRFLSRATVFAMEVCRSKAITWDAGKQTKRGEHTKLEQNATLEGATLKRVTWTESVECS